MSVSVNSNISGALMSLSLFLVVSTDFCSYCLYVSLRPATEGSSLLPASS